MTLRFLFAPRAGLWLAAARAPDRREHGALGIAKLEFTAPGGRFPRPLAEGDERD